MVIQKISREISRNFGFRLWSVKSFDFNIFACVYSAWIHTTSQSFLRINVFSQQISFTKVAFILQHFWIQVYFSGAKLLCENTRKIGRFESYYSKYFQQEKRDTQDKYFLTKSNIKFPLFKRSYSCYKTTFWLAKIAKKHEKFDFWKCFYLLERHLWNLLYGVSGVGKCFLFCFSSSEAIFTKHCGKKHQKPKYLRKLYYQMLWTVGETSDLWGHFKT